MCIRDRDSPPRPPPPTPPGQRCGAKFYSGPAGCGALGSCTSHQSASGQHARASSRPARRGSRCAS
eukprot:2825457-Prorocentrum_lima.AAC.1